MADHSAPPGARTAGAFAPEGAYLPHSSSMDFCESNYEYSPDVVETWNSYTSLHIVYMGFCLWLAVEKVAESLGHIPWAKDGELSNLPDPRDALYGREATALRQRTKDIKLGRFYLLAGIVMTVGLGSTLFHGTLATLFQMLDEIPMLTANFVMAYVLENSVVRRWREEERLMGDELKTASGKRSGFPLGDSAASQAVSAWVSYWFGTSWTNWLTLVAVSCVYAFGGEEDLNLFGGSKSVQYVFFISSYGSMVFYLTGRSFSVLRMQVPPASMLVRGIERRRAKRRASLERAESERSQRSADGTGTGTATALTASADANTGMISDSNSSTRTLTPREGEAYGSSDFRDLLFHSMKFYFFGWSLWMLENMACHTVVIPVPGLGTGAGGSGVTIQDLHLHIIWHFFAGYGTVCYIVALMVLTIDSENAVRRLRNAVIAIETAEGAEGGETSGTSGSGKKALDNGDGSWMADYANLEKPEDAVLKRTEELRYSVSWPKLYGMPLYCIWIPTLKIEGLVKRKVE